MATCVPPFWSTLWAILSAATTPAVAAVQETRVKSRLQFHICHLNPKQTRVIYHGAARLNSFEPASLFLWLVWKDCCQAVRMLSHPESLKVF